MSALVTPATTITVTAAQEAVLDIATDLIGLGLPTAYEGRGGSTQFIYSDEDETLRLILDADGAFIDLEMWDNEEDSLIIEDGQPVSFDSDWVSIEEGDLGSQIAEAING